MTTNSVQAFQPWDRLRQETDKSWAAFILYREMLPFGAKGESRSLFNAGVKLGYKDQKQLEKWSAKYQWANRVAAYDSHKARTSIEIRDASLQEYQKAVTQSLTIQLTVLNEILDRSLGEMKDKMDAGTNPDPLEIKRLAAALREKDDLARRVGSMPTGFIRKTIPDTGEDEDMIFVIGGGAK
ncbi:hypothetical protein LCGC14_0990330 [marine sediment metagenome]|uniref:Uncharacterized protein n=1 Tax=marine sediment metagenome TaxID=412755 RepID=A0A0F9N5W3_9ZZZZ